VLPSISTYVITYFSCARFDRGNKRDLRVIASELSIKCTSKRYRRWAVYVAIMIALWPVGATLGLAVLLWRNRGKLNPEVPAEAIAQHHDQDDDVDGFQRERKRHRKAMDQLRKLAVRDEDDSVKGLEFLFEECVRFSRKKTPEECLVGTSRGAISSLSSKWFGASSYRPSSPSSIPAPCSKSSSASSARCSPTSSTPTTKRSSKYALSSFVQSILE